MRQKNAYKAFPIGCLVLAVFSYGNAWADSGMVSASATEERILKPGDVQLCKKDFLIYNKGNDLAEYMVIIGNATYEKKQLPAHGNKFFDLQKSISELRQEGQANVRANDMAIILNTGKDGKVGLNCPE
ncbi:MAG: hypothetical protein HZA02_07970 [Nitrospinae bacterium]|nr:hypothetical protein [Nitrospinota bacterium]